jgi:hypothetical protein
MFSVPNPSANTRGEHVQFESSGGRMQCFPRFPSLVAALGLVLLPAAGAAQTAVEVLEAGWSGTAVPGTWTPVRLRVKAGPAELRGLAEVVVEAELPSRSQNAPLRLPIASYAQEITLRGGETRDVLIWFPAQNQIGIRARLSEGGKTRAESVAQLKTARLGWPAIAVMAEGPAILRALRGIELPYQGLPVPIVVSELVPAQVPRSGRLLEAITGLVVEGSGPVDLTDAQRAAVLEWVRGGGHLIVSGGPAAVHALRVIPDGALPVSSIEFRGAADISALGRWMAMANLPGSAPVSAFRAEGGAVLAGSADRPLAWRTRVGKGSVTILAIDPALEPMASWSGATALWKTALAPALHRMTNDPQTHFTPPSLGQRLMDNGGMLPANALPGWRTAAGVLVLFALIVGPVLYLVLRRIDRNELRWIAVPVAALVFSVGAYFTGIRSGGQEGITNISTYIDFDGEGGRARQAIVASFYGPMKRELSIPLPHNIPVRATTEAEVSRLPLAGMLAADSGSRRGRRSEPPFQVVDGTNRRVRFNGSRFALRHIFLERELSRVPRISAEVTLQGGLLIGTVRNDSDIPLDHAAVMIGNAVARLGEIAPGQSVPVRLDPAAAKDMSPYLPLSFLLYRTPKANRPAGQGRGMYVNYSQYEMPNDPETRRRARFVDRVMGREGEPMRRSLPLTLIAFTQAHTASDVVRSTSKNVHELSMLRLPIELLLQPGPFELPTAFNRPEVLESSGTSGRRGTSLQGNTILYPIELRGDSVIYAFRPPLPGTARAETLILTTQQLERSVMRNRDPNPNVAPDAAAAGVFSIFDWRTGEWQALPEGSEHRLPAHLYLGPGGEVRVRGAAGEDQIIVIVEPSLVVQGRAGVEGQP